jgi:hypothetical protein
MYDTSRDDGADSCDASSERCSHRSRLAVNCSLCVFSALSALSCPRVILRSDTKVNLGAEGAFRCVFRPCLVRSASKPANLASKAAAT